MPLVEFSQIIDAADEGEYAVGYFESWNLSHCWQWPTPLKPFARR
jgi:hypothetical protein